MTERSYPTSEVRVRGREDPMPEGRRPRGVTPHPRSGAAAERRYPASEVSGSDKRSYPTFEVRGSGQEELPHAPMPKARGSSQEDQPHAVAARAQEVLEELSHVEGQEGRQ